VSTVLTFVAAAALLAACSHEDDGKFTQCADWTRRAVKGYLPIKDVANREIILDCCARAEEYLSDRDARHVRASRKAVEVRRSCGKLAPQLRVPIEAGDSGAAAAPPQRRSGLLSSSYRSPEGLVVVHYPPWFKAEPLQNNGVMLTFDDAGQAISFVSTETPPRPDLHDMAQWVEEGVEQAYPGFRRTGRHDDRCHGVPCVRFDGAWSDGEAHEKQRYRACAFIRNGHGHFFYWSLPETRADDGEAMLRSIDDAVEFLR
jgi:hypothetical protein